MAPTVSVVIPAYNAAEYVAQAVRSVLAQTFTDWELIIVNDGSTDDTAERVVPFLSDPRILLYTQENGGPASARNAGIARSSGPFIALLDADDYWLPTKLEKQLAIMANWPDVGVCGNGRVHVSPLGKPLRTFLGDGYCPRPLPRLLFKPLADMTTALIRRPVFERVGVFDESLRFCEDYEFWLRVGRYYGFYVIREPLSCYRTGQLKNRPRFSQRVTRAQVLNTILPKFLEQHGGRHFVRPWHIWRLKALFDKANGDDEVRKLWRIAWYLRAIAKYPLLGDAYRATGSTLVPKSVRLRLKALLSGKRVLYSEPT